LVSGCDTGKQRCRQGGRLKSPGCAGRRRDAESRSGGEQNGEHRHGLGHGDQGRVSYGDLREHNGLG
jgi:hypothetical protein